VLVRRFEGESWMMSSESEKATPIGIILEVLVGWIEVNLPY